MSNFSKLLEKELMAEIDYLLNNKYVSYAAKQNKYLYEEGLIEELNKPEIDLKRIKQYTGIDLYTCNEAYQMYILEEPFNVKKGTYAKSKIMKNLVLLKYYLGSTNPKTKGIVMDILMSLHCGDYKSLEFSFGKDTYNLLHDFDTKLDAKEFHFDHKIAIKFLKYYYTHKDNLQDEEYKELLDSYAEKMIKYLEFYGLDEIDFINADPDMNFVLDKSNYELIKFFYDKEIPRTRNHYCDLNTIKELLVNGENRKDMLITILSVFNVTDELVEEFNGVQLAYEDIFNYITKYEQAGNVLTNKQIEKLLINFKKYYFYSNGQKEQYDAEVELVKNCYYEYCYDNFDDSVSNFIEYFNKKGYRLSYFSNVGEAPLNRVIFNEIINNKPASIRYFSSTQSAKNYVDNMVEERNTNTYSKKYIKDEYYSLLEGYMYTKGITFEYFLRKYIPENEREEVRELANWYCKRNNTDLEVSTEAKCVTAKLIYKDMKEEILSRPIKERTVISEKYKQIIEENELDEIYFPCGLQFFLRQLTSEIFADVQPKFIKEFNEAINNGTNPYLVVEKYGLTPADARTLLRRTYGSGKKYQEKSSLMKEGLDQRSAEQIAIRHEKKANRRKVLLSGYAASELGLKEYAERVGIPEKEVINWISENDPVGQEKYQKELELEARHLDNLDAIIFGINNGVESNNTVRKFTFFDLLMLQEKPIGFEEAQRILVDSETRYGVPGYSIINVKQFLAQTKGTYNRPTFFERYDDSIGTSLYVSSILKSDITLSTDSGLRKITEEEKQYVLGFIEEMGYPGRVFFDALCAYANGDYDFEEKRNSYVKKKENN